MSGYEYMVVPAPKVAPRAKGVKGTDARLAHGLAEMLNDRGSEGWEFQRTETMTVETKAGFFSRPRVEQVAVMIFRRPLGNVAAAGAPHPAWRDAAAFPAPAADAPSVPPRPAGQPLTASRRPEGALHPVPRPDRG